MHDTAYAIGRKFLELYLGTRAAVIVEIGSMNVNGTLRECCPPDVMYLGLDLEHGPGVDLVIRSNEKLPLRSDFADIVLSSSQMEHDPMFWKTFLELVRLLKPGGVLYLNVPSNGSYHCYPGDFWRFYPDSAKALETWSRENGYELTLIESFVAERMKDQWNDFVAVFKKSDAVCPDDVELISDHFASTNVYSVKFGGLGRARPTPEDGVIITRLEKELQSARGGIDRPASELGHMPPELPEPSAEKERRDTGVVESRPFCGDGEPIPDAVEATIHPASLNSDLV